ncbi:acyltransferase family protein [Streptosporangium roseum]|uniref:Acyltransferase-like protein n=1 Tax=Streptosporangium roseum (strain ATCC 12428 / DSM 43021 / JCM 3005 / KCTC 9067 / NCIMB 10171 / NRRL 2505 / NI 9100) TaxID=479432 RepID=D2AQC4_STRRD|nr:acyltransferase [Streptosporangium roseum]ACZ84468.1 acyltransferase-like protein [Streptosporangium roseum DSM 43021]
MTETSSTSTASPAVDGHQDALDGMRAVAAFVVLLYHVAMESGEALKEGFGGALLSRGDVGVPIFFILSGMLLYRPFAAATMSGAPAPRTRTYLRKRGLRILPAYWLVVVVAVLVWSRDHVTDAATWLYLLLLGQNYNPDPWWFGLGPKGLAQMWSLSVEASFYLTLPLMALALDRYARGAGPDPVARARRLLAGLAAPASISYIWTVFSFVPVYQPHLNIWLPRSLIYFAGGMALAVLTLWARAEPEGPAARAARTITASWGSCWLVAALTFAFAASPVTGVRFLGLETLWTGLFELVLYSIVALCLVAPVALPAGRETSLRSFLGSRIMRYLGRISYGVFLWQFVVLFLWYETTGQRPWSGNFPINLVAVTLLTVALADLTYRFVEEPARRLGSRRRPVTRAVERPSAVRISDR